jgi:phage shock protein PspC (stress-responsive transcriptional regulator)
LGESQDVDPDLVRALWIVLGLWGGAGIIAYAAAIFLLPEGELVPEHRTPARRNRNLGLVLIAVAGALLFAALGISIFPQPALFFGAAWKVLLPLLLLGAGALLIWPAAREKVGLGRGRKFHRSSTNRILAGVCGGLGAKLGVDPNLVRVAAVLLAFLSAGSIILLYVILILIFPEERPILPERGEAPPSDQVSPGEHR